MNKRYSIIVSLVVGLLTAITLAQEKERSPGATEASIQSAAELQWAEGPPSLPAGAQMVVLDGNPSERGSFTIRLKMPPGYKIAPHTHPVAERVTVISGVVRLGIGAKFDEAAGREMKPGDFAVLPANVPHYAWSEGEAVLQIHSEGPFRRTFVDPADEPSVR